MNLYTIGVSKKSAEDFFNLLKNANVEILLDIRLNNNSQLLGFSKGRDLKYFCEKCHKINYEHVTLLAPTKDLIKRYRKDKNWTSYEKDFKKLLDSRQILETFNKSVRGFKNICLLCSEPKTDKCHRRLVAEFIKNHINNLKIIHL